ncbi:hypothetical protein [Brevundimonas sp.]|uniref:hypothetical protein n=1 Tax=Brevundimonas sp. TaxID=1871086 RepID=UPI00262BB056|nr:hypothetical protein [Brevundimonas sp.]
MRARVWAIAAVLASTAVAAPAGASNDDMSAAFGNTVITHYPDGGWVKHWFNPDNTYAAQFSDGRRISARWRVEGRNVCLTHIRPSMLIPRFCSPLIEAQVGETWQARDPMGRRVRNTLVSGRV